MAIPVIEKVEQMNQLYDCYGELLTSKQQNIFTMYYQDDFSYQEIAENLEISRSAVFDSLKRVESALEHYESVLHLVRNEQQVNQLLSSLMTLNIKDVNIQIEKFKKEEGKKE